MYSLSIGAFDLSELEMVKKTINSSNSQRLVAPVAEQPGIFMEPPLTFRFAKEPPESTGAIGITLLDCWFPSDASDFTVCVNSPVVENELQSQKTDVDQVADRLTNSSRLVGALPDAFETSHLSTKGPRVLERRALLYFGDDKPHNARCLITFSNALSFVSLTFRMLGRDKTPKHAVSVFPELSGPISGGLLRCVEPKPCGDETNKFLFSPDATADEILQLCGLVELTLETGTPPNKPTQGSKVAEKSLLVRPPVKNVHSHAAGLIVVAGATGTGKSTVATAICLRYLLHVASSAKPDQVPPHLVTFEDPIEEWKLTKQWNDKCILVDLLSSPASAQSHGLWLTARQKGKDVRSIADARLHALRQKPSVIYVGEVRDGDDWSNVMDLSNTGHLVVTTCHASSLVDTFSKLAGLQVRDAQGRRTLAATLLAVVHMKNLTLATIPPKIMKDSAHEQTFITCWRRTTESINNFVVDGMSSLIPDRDNVFSRRSMAESILKRQVSSPYLHMSPLADWKNASDELHNAALNAASLDDRSVSS